MTPSDVFQNWSKHAIERFALRYPELVKHATPQQISWIVKQIELQYRDTFDKLPGERVFMRVEFVRDKKNAKKWAQVSTNAMKLLIIYDHKAKVIVTCLPQKSGKNYGGEALADFKHYQIRIYDEHNEDLYKEIVL